MGVNRHCKSLHVKLSVGEKIPCHIRELNMRQWYASLTLYRLSYIPAPEYPEYFFVMF